MTQVAKKLLTGLLMSSKFTPKYSKILSNGSLTSLFKVEAKSLHNTFEYSFFSRKKNEEGAEDQKASNAEENKSKENPKEENQKTEKKEETNQKETAQKESADKEAARIKKLESQLQEKSKELEDLKRKYDVSEKRNDDFQKKVTELRDNLVKQIDEVESTTKRLQKEKEAMKVYAVQKFAKEMLEVADNLGMALKTSAKKYENTNDDLYEGVKMTSHILGKIFERNGIHTISPLNEKFDPNMHEALFELEDPKLQPGTCGHIAQVGYKIGDRCLRPARVGVVKSRPATEETKSEEPKKE